MEDWTDLTPADGTPDTGPIPMGAYLALLGSDAWAADRLIDKAWRTV
jgi:hypothetical protein